MPNLARDLKRRVWKRHTGVCCLMKNRLKCHSPLIFTPVLCFGRLTKIATVCRARSNTGLCLHTLQFVYVGPRERIFDLALWTYRFTFSFTLILRLGTTFTDYGAKWNTKCTRTCSGIFTLETREVPGLYIVCVNGLLVFLTQVKRLPLITFATEFILRCHRFSQYLGCDGQ